MLPELELSLPHAGASILGTVIREPWVPRLLNRRTDCSLSRLLRSYVCEELGKAKNVPGRERLGLTKDAFQKPSLLFFLIWTRWPAVQGPATPSVRLVQRQREPSWPWMCCLQPLNEGTWGGGGWTAGCSISLGTDSGRMKRWSEVEPENHRLRGRFFSSAVRWGGLSCPQEDCTANTLQDSWTMSGPHV